MNSASGYIVLQDSIILTQPRVLPQESESDTSEPVILPKTDATSIAVQKSDSAIILPVISGTAIKKEQVTIDKEKLVTEKRTEKADTSKTYRSGESHKLFNYPGNQYIFHYSPLPIWHVDKTCRAFDKCIKFNINKGYHSQFDWALLIGLFSILLLIGINSYYRKFVNQVINTLVNVQLANKLLREKNVIVRRAFFMMNLIFLLIFSLFVVLVMDYYELGLTKQHVVNYFIILGIIGVLLFVRLVLYYTVGYIFDWISAINQQIHSNYLINKNVGLIMFPLVFAIIYTSPPVSETLIYIGIGIFLITSVFKLLRAFRIILRNGILLFYAILYLCTLELLPWVLGSKLILYLR